MAKGARGREEGDGRRGRGGGETGSCSELGVLLNRF